MKLPGNFEERKEFSLKRLTELRGEIDALESVAGITQFCIYVTGSYGRLEAAGHSDIDLFFLRGSKNTPSRIEKTLIDADLIRIGRELRFPELSNDGQFLQIHEIDRVVADLGTPEDDYSNRFTARLLLLLESRPLFGDDYYEEAIREIVGAYCRDFPDHEDRFRAVFLANDVMRFWKTLCLNYESRRNQLAADDNAKAKVQVRNLKLKFSRMMTCFSGLALLMYTAKLHTPDDLVRLVKLSPTERLTEISSTSTDPQLIEIFDHYGWFLDNIAQPAPDAVKCLSDVISRKEAHERAAAFGNAIYTLLKQIDPTPSFLRYLVA